MSCHGCATKFGAFTKEKGCPVCGFAFCKKCLRFKAIVPKLGMSEQNVCRSCFEELTSEKKDAEKEFRPPPDTFLRSEPAFPNLPNPPSYPSISTDTCARGNGVNVKKCEVETLVRRLESLENPARPPITVYHHDPRMEQLKTGLTAEDREIAERLEKLKEERKRHREMPTEEDIVRRLAALKGQDPDRAVDVTLKKKEVFKLPDSRSDEEKTNDLIKQLIQEQILEAKHISPEELIAKRLARLRGEDSTNPTPKQSSELDLDALASKPDENEKDDSPDDMHQLMKMAKAEFDAVQTELKGGQKSKLKDEVEKESESDDESAVALIVKKAMDEPALNDEDELECSEPTSIQDPGELPWCTICNEDAIIRCLGCDGDLFCSKCFYEFHDDSEMKQHHNVKFSPQKKI